MTALLRTLEAWTVHQDYFWFLGLLAWAAVAYGATRPEVTGGKPQRWLALLAATFALICALEIGLFASAAYLATPFTGWDFCLGLALSAAVGALFQPLVDRLKSSVRRSAATVLIATTLTTLSVWRWWSPILAGEILALSAAIGTFALVRAPDVEMLSAGATGGERKLARTWLLLLAIIPALVDFGPLSYWTENGRRFRDLSDFSLLSSLLCLGAGVVGASLLWRRYVRTAAWSERARQELRTPIALLAVWLAAGFALTVGSGWLARRNYERDIVLRLKNAAAALDPEMLRVVLGPQLRLGPLSDRSLGAGKPVAAADSVTERIRVTTLNPSFMGRAPFEPLTAKLRQLDILNSDLRQFRLLSIRGGYLFAPVTVSDRPITTRTVKQPDGTTRTVRTAYGLRVVYRPATIDDYVDLHSKRAVLDPPTRGLHGSTLGLRVPLQPPGSPLALGWLAAELSASTWRATFASARFQTMLMVGIGVALWATAIGYRLRRLEREQAERIAREAAAADRAKSEFLAHVSHELRTPIQSVLGYAELLASAPLELIERQRLSALRSQGDLLLRLVNDLIDLGALQAGVFRLQSAPVDAAALTRECLEAIRPQADAKRLALQLQLDPKIRWIEVDGQRLRQILLNLLANAVKFTDAGTITLALQRVAEASGMIEWSVRDTGPGIAPEDQERIFEPFVRLDRDQAIAGAGMGLALCARLCTAMNGALTVSSDGETGTTFTVRLPLPSVEASLRDVRPGAHEQGRREAASPSEAWRGLRVLIADDNTLVRELLVAFFEAQQAAITAVADGLAAVEACATCEFDVIVLDLSMPWLDGREAARRLREPGVALGQPWIIGLSAHAGREEAETALAAGMNRFLTKPVALRELAAVVAEAPRLRAQPMPSPVTNTADLALARRLTRQFAAETPAIVTELHAAFANGDRSRLRSRAHYLKNSADVLGADALRRACTALYVQAESADPEALRELVATIESAARSPLASAEFRPENPAQSQPQ